MKMKMMVSEIINSCFLFRFPPQLLGISIAQAVDCGLTGTDRLGLKGSVRASNGRGDGNVAAIWKKNIGGVALEVNFIIYFCTHI